MAGGTGLILDDRFTFHDTGTFHVETAERIRSIKRSFEVGQLFDHCTVVEPVPAPLEWIKQNHTSQYIDRVREACLAGSDYIDTPDSAISAQSYEVALLAAGSVLQAIDSVMSGRFKNFFVACRPPGHHAEFDRSMGFCLFNNVAIGARYLLQHYGIERVLILDWDVHHGNGTQHSFEDSPNVFYCSLHGHPMNLYPGTGFEWEHGTGAGEGFTLNVPLMPGTDDNKYCRAFTDICLPRFKKFKPEFIIISAGFDAHRADPIGNLALEDETFGWLTDQCLELAAQYSNDRVISVLEGGYNLDALGRCAALHFRRLCQSSRG